jgi:hypothetical protein
MSSENKLIENLLYSSGLTAQGCWDQLDSYAQDAIIRAIQMTAQECASVCMSQADKRNIRHCFGLPVESNVKYPGPEAVNSIQSQYKSDINIPKT